MERLSVQLGFVGRVGLSSCNETMNEGRLRMQLLPKERKKERKKPRDRSLLGTGTCTHGQADVQGAIVEFFFVVLVFFFFSTTPSSPSPCSSSFLSLSSLIPSPSVSLDIHPTGLTSDTALDCLSRALSSS